MKKYSSLQFYQETLIIQAAFGDAILMKQAEEGIVDSLISAVKSYMSGHVDENDKVGSAINILSPGIVMVMLRSLGLGWLGFIAGLAMEIFHVDVKSLIQSALSKLIGPLKAGEKLTPEQIKSAVDGTFNPEANKEPSKEEVEQFQTKGFTVREALLYKTAMTEAVIEYKLTKNAGIFDLFSGGKRGTISLLGSAVKWIFITVLASLGLMVGGDVANMVLGRPSALTGTLQGGKPTELPQSEQVATSVSKQNKFPISSSYDKRVLNSGSTTWTETGAPTDSNIRNMALNWMKEVYDGVSQYENLASNTIGFRNVVQEIVDHNSGNASGKITYIPRMFTTKKNAVDIFIDEVANKSGPSNLPASKPAAT